MLRLLRQKVKYVFVIFNENHSFDNEFGTFPGANGIFADGTGPRDAAHTPGFTQTYKDNGRHRHTLTPFRIGPEQNASFIDSVDHSHAGLAHKLHVVDGKPHRWTGSPRRNSTASLGARHPGRRGAWATSSPAS